MYKRELQSIDTQEKAYLLGLFYSDGHVGIGQNQCRITLKLEDKELILHLQKLFPFFYIHYDRGTKIEMGNYTKFLKNDLINNGCFPRKSFENKDKLHIPKLKSDLMRHFIRGYFDGDGGCTLSHSGGKTQKRVYIYSASLDFLGEIQKTLSEYNIESNVSTQPTTGIPIYKLGISTLSYKRFYKFLYEDCSIYMKRKKSKFDSILETKFFVQKVAPECKFCGSSNTICDGYNYYKVRRQRYLCKDCKKHFSAPLGSNI